MHIKAILNGVIVSCEDGNSTLTFFMVGFNTILCSLYGVNFKAMPFTETVAVNDNILDQRTDGPVNANHFFPGVTTTVKGEKGQHRFLEAQLWSMIGSDQISNSSKL